MHKWIILFLVFSLGFTSCYDEDNQFGSSFVSSAFRNVYVDSCTVQVSSAKIDSLETNGQEVALIGNYHHDTWGTITSTTYIPYSVPSYSTDIDDPVVLDSLILTLRYNSYALGDTNQYQNFTIHRLTEKIESNTNGYIYNHTSFQYDPTPIAKTRFRPRTGYDIEVRLPDDMGNDMLTRLHKRDESVSSDRFEEYFKGLVIKAADDECNALLSFAVGDTAMALTLHYHIRGEVNNDLECLIKVNTENQFYNISHDRTGTDLESLSVKGVEIPSESLSNRGFVFGGIGWYTILKFPYLNNLCDHGERISIESAYLKIHPERGTYSQQNPLPDSVYLYITDENNVVTDAVKDYLGSEVQKATLYYDETYPDQTYYTFDVSDFMQQELGTIGIYKHNLRLVFVEDDYIKTFNNLTISDQNGKNPISLHITYKIYESY